MTPTNTISPELEAALTRIRNRIKWAEEQPWFNPSDPDWREDMVPFFPRFTYWFPATAHGKPEDRSDLRHCILMALTGRAISTQYELSAGIHSVLKRDILNANSAYLTRSLADELTEAVQGPFSLTPWTIPAGRPEPARP